LSRRVDLHIRPPHHDRSIGSEKPHGSVGRFDAAVAQLATGERVQKRGAILFLSARVGIGQIGAQEARGAPKLRREAVVITNEWSPQKNGAVSFRRVLGSTPRPPSATLSR